MFRYVSILFTFLFLFFSVPAFAQEGGIGAGAAGVVPGSEDATEVDPTPKAAAGKYGIDVTVEEAQKGQAIPNVGKTVIDLIAQFISVALSLVATIFFLLMVYAGFLWMTAHGETGQVETAKKVLTAAVMGVVVIAASYAIIKFVIDAFG